MQDKLPLMLMMKKTQRQWNNYMQKLALSVGVPDTYRHVFMYLSKHPGSSQKEIAQFSQKTHAAISQTIKEMEKDGYIQKTTNQEDQRYFKLYLTQKGEQARDRFHSKIKQADDLITKTITKDKENEMLLILEKINALLEQEEIDA